MTSKELKKKKDELERLAREVEELERREKLKLNNGSVEIKNLVESILILSENHFMKPDEIISIVSSEIKPSKKRGRIEPKYYNPSNPDEKWTGRGRKPVWVSELIEMGEDMEKYLIENMEETNNTNHSESNHNSY
jgi:DNA-binding protein H-NS